MERANPKPLEPREESTAFLFSSPLLQASLASCHRARRGPSEEEQKSDHMIGIPLSGVNMRHVAGQSFAVSPGNVTLSNRGEPYRVSHPYGSGERMVNVVVRDDVLLDLLAQQDPHVEERPEFPSSSAR